jgi:hypothetical protein
MDHLEWSRKRIFGTIEPQCVIMHLALASTSGKETLHETAAHVLILRIPLVLGKLSNSSESAIPMSDFMQQLFEAHQMDVAEEMSEALSTGLSFKVVILLALVAYILTRFILLRILVRFYARTKSKAGEILLEKSVFQPMTIKDITVEETFKEGETVYRR